MSNVRTAISFIVLKLGFNSGGDNQMYQIRTPTTGSSIPGVVMAGPGAMQSPQQMAEEASRKRELRLMKNRWAFSICAITSIANFHRTWKRKRISQGFFLDNCRQPKSTFSVSRKMKRKNSIFRTCSIGFKCIHSCMRLYREHFAFIQPVTTLALSIFL